MKRILLSILGFSLACGVQAQITLTNANMPVAAGSTTVATTDLSTPVPVRGANQTWDYGNMLYISATTTQYHASTNAQFPGAIYREGAAGQLAPAWIYNYNPYYSGTNSFYGIVGHQVPVQRYTLAPLTGSNSDSLVFPAQTYVFPATAPDAFLRYPATYNSTWKSTYKHTLNANITVLFAGLNKAPMQRRSTITVTDSVVGWGNMRVPFGTSGNTPSQLYPVLMVKRVETAVDSFYLNGSPASSILLGALTVSQGQTRTNNSYKFYRENARQPLMEFDFRNSNFNNPEMITYDRSTSVVSGISRDFASKLPVSLYPNPSNSSSVTLSFNKPESGDWQLKLVDITGRRVSEQTIKVTGTVKETINLPTSVKNGLYSWQLVDSKNAIRSAGKLSVVR